ncbi:hypothetical protein RSP03_01160 [Cereibacter sphaeroides]|nr:hypothetical protein RSP03_01160 [Cereibacter sphaeroides]
MRGEIAEIEELKGEKGERQNHRHEGKRQGRGGEPRLFHVCLTIECSTGKAPKPAFRFRNRPIRLSVVPVAVSKGSGEARDPPGFQEAAWGLERSRHLWAARGRGKKGRSVWLRPPNVTRR